MIAAWIGPGQLRIGDRDAGAALHLARSGLQSRPWFRAADPTIRPRAHDVLDLALDNRVGPQSGDRAARTAIDRGCRRFGSRAEPPAALTAWSSV
jgi:hypothetical protein